MRFDELDLEDEILDGLYDMNFSEMTPVQEHTIPVILSGRDIIGCAQTGTGKTAAYTLPLLNRLLIEGNPDNVIKSVIIVPTRELAQQIDQQFQGFSYYLPVSTTVVYGGGDGKGSVYYLNFKPEQDGDWQNLAKAYTEETGVPVTVVTAASGQYETTLMAEMGKTEAPTLFQVNGPVGLQNWKDYCYDFTGSKVLGELTSEDFALKNGDEVAGIGYVIETYGIIVNTKLLDKAGYSVDDIQSFADLKKVADDIQARKDEIGVKGAFTSAGMVCCSAAFAIIQYKFVVVIAAIIS